MKRKNTMRNALVTSVISMLLCVSMLVGTTFAWFTDSVTSGVNTIAAGNLDVELYHGKTQDPTDKVNAETLLFTDASGKEIKLWEPGVVAFTNLKVANVGTLALKYQLSVNSTKMNTVKDSALTLEDALKVAVVKGGVTGDRAAVIAAGDAARWEGLKTFTLSGKLEGDEKSETYGIVIYWQPGDNDNLFNMNNGKTTSNGEPLSITLGVNLFATQEMYEGDSFGTDYDKGAAWTGNVDTDWYFANPGASEFAIGSAEELAGLAAIVNTGVQAPATTFSARAAELVQDDFKGKTIKLTANIDLRDINWSPIGTNESPFLGNFDGQGYTVSNLNVSNSGWAGLFGHVGINVGSTIKNVKINGATIRSNRMAGAVVGQLYGSIENCHATDVEIIVIPNAVGSTYDNGDKVGGIVGWLGDNGNNRTVTNCSVTNAAISAYRDVGGIVGYAANSTKLSGNKVSTVKITVDQSTNNYGDKEPNAGEIWGRAGGDNVTGENNTSSEVTFDVTYSKNGLTLMADPAAGTVTLYLVPESYAEATVNVPEGVTHIGRYAFAYNTNVEKIVLPSSVKTLDDRAFRDTSASQVVLNEGLTNISYQAFRNASNVKSVVIPSTVKTISKEAFQNSGITTLTIPKTVETLEYGVCRDMKELETVIIEGNVDIPVYAFRACTNLKTVILTGDDVTFGAKGMIFTNKENGDGSAMTIYVENETVKERLVAADTAAKAYGGYKIIVDAPIVKDADGLVEALENGQNVVLSQDVKISPNGMSNAYGATGLNVKNGQTIDGGGNVLDIKNAGGTWDSGISTTGGLIQNITITGSFRGVFVNHNSTHSETVILKNVIIDGTVYTISCDQGKNQNLEAYNSTFNGWTSYAETIGKVKFVECNFGEGSGYAYCRPYAPTVFQNCNFEAGFTVDPRAEVTFENCYLDGVKLTAENIAELVTGTANVTVK